MDTIEYGAMQAVRNCARVKKGEKVVLVTDRKAQHIGYALARQVEAIGGYTSIHVMEDYGTRPTQKEIDRGAKALGFPDRLRDDILKDTTVTFYTSDCLPGELDSFRKPMIGVAMGTGRIRHAHMPGVNDTIMAQGMAVDYSKVQKLSAKVAEVVRPASEIRIQTRLGTDLTARFTQKHKWYVCDALINEPGMWTNLPDGEVFTCPETAEGLMVIDGVLGDHFNEKYGILGERNAVVLRFKDGRLNGITAKDPKLQRELEKYAEMDENANRMGEFAIGTNIGLDGFIGNMLQDEKFPGFHAAIGDPHGDHTGATWESKAHMDGVVTKPTITVDGKIIMEEGRFLL